MKTRFALLRFGFGAGSTLVALWLSGCAADRGHLDRAHVSAQLQERTEHSLNPKAAKAEDALPDGVNLADGISEQEAVSLALWNNAAFQETLAQLGFARADLMQAGLLSNPTLSLLFPLGPKQLEFAAKFPVEAFWLRPRRVRLARLEGERVAEGLVQNGLDLVRDVKVAFSDLQLAQEKSRLAADALELRDRIAGLAAARLRAGDLSELEATTARVDSLRAREEANRLGYDAQLARQKLVNLIGLGAKDERYDFNRELPMPGPEEGLSSLETKALAARPDVRAAELGVEIACQRAGLQKAEAFAVSGILDANGSGKEGFEMGPGVELPIPIFNRNQAGIARARADLERASWHYVALKDRIRLELREAHTKFAQAKENLRFWEQDILPPLEVSVRQAEKAYQLGDVSLLLVYENTRQLLAGRVREAEINADLRRASAELERSVGQRLDKPPMPAQP